MYFWSPAFDVNIGSSINESPSYTLTSAILKVDVVYDVMTSTPNVLTTELRDLLYNQCIDNTCCYSFFIYPTGWISVCKKRFVSTGENRRKPCLVCKKLITHTFAILSTSYIYCYSVFIATYSSSRENHALLFTIPHPRMFLSACLL